MTTSTHSPEPSYGYVSRCPVCAAEYAFRTEDEAQDCSEGFFGGQKQPARRQPTKELARLREQNRRLATHLETLLTFIDEGSTIKPDWAAVRQARLELAGKGEQP